MPWHKELAVLEVSRGSAAGISVSPGSDDMLVSVDDRLAGHERQAWATSEEGHVRITPKAESGRRGRGIITVRILPDRQLGPPRGPDPSTLTGAPHHVGQFCRSFHFRGRTLVHSRSPSLLLEDQS